MFGNMTGDLDSESLDSDTDLNIEGEGDSDLEGFTSDIGRPSGAIGSNLVIGGGGPEGKVGVGGGKVKGTRMRGPAAAAALIQGDDDDF